MSLIFGLMLVLSRSKSVIYAFPLIQAAWIAAMPALLVLFISELACRSDFAMSVRPPKHAI